MRKQTHSTVMALTFISSIAATLAISSIGSAAYAANSTACQQTLRPVTTGGAAREQLEAMAKCKSNEQPSTNSGASMQSPVDTLTQPKAADINQPTTRVDPYPAYCEPLPSWVKPGSFEYNEALNKCKYGG